MALKISDEFADRIRQGRVMLFLGAGASYESKNKDFDDVAQSNQLKKRLEDVFDEKFDDEDKLQDIASYFQSIHRYEDFLDFLKQQYTECTPSDDLKILLSGFWPKIYTTNIDDTIINPDIKTHENLRVFGIRSGISDYSILERKTDVIYLHGMGRKLDEGIVFSKSEYVSQQIETTPWYDQLANDLYFNKFLIVGTKLEEPIFDFVLERHAKKTSERPEFRGYVVTPSISKAKEAYLVSNGIIHIPGTLKQVCDWLQINDLVGLSADSVIDNRFPEIAALKSESKSKSTDSLLGIFRHVTYVNELKHSKNHAPPGKVRDFYRGIKPSWDEIIENIPAEVSHHKKIEKALTDFTESSQRVLVITGPAGSGKTTALKTLSLDIARKKSIKVFYLENHFGYFHEIVEKLSKYMSGEKCILVFDSLDMVSADLAAFLSKKEFENVYFLCSERRNIWNERTSSLISQFSSAPVQIEQITRYDAELILEKLEMFGPMGLLRKHSKSHQVDIIHLHSKRQLLMGLLEATHESGFERIIRSEYDRIINNENRMLMLLAALGSVHRLALPGNLLFSAFTNLFQRPPKPHNFQSLSGILVPFAGSFEVRHPVYAQYIIDVVSDPMENFKALSALLQGFSRYGSPIFHSKNKQIIQLFIMLVRSKFVLKALRNKEELVISFYENGERYFPSDSQFALQHGLALRNFKKQDYALLKIRQAHSIYSTDNSRHALAQQLMIVASQRQSWNDAEILFNEAMNHFEILEDVITNLNLYPLITQAESHVDLMKVFFGVEQARETAVPYIQKMQSYARRNQFNERYQKSIAKLKNI